MGTGTVEKPWAQTRNETAGENLQNDAVLMMRPRGNVFNVHSPDGGMRAVMDRTLKVTRDGYRWRLCRRGCTARYRGVTRRQYLERDAVRTRKVVPERYDPAPGRVAPAARSRKRRCVRYVRTVRPPDAGAI